MPRAAAAADPPASAPSPTADEQHDRPAEYLAAASPWVPLDRLQLMKLAYFSQFCALPLLSVYAPLVYNSKGFGASTTGWLLAVPALGTMVVTPPVATFAETRHAQVAVLTCAAGAAAMLATTVLLSANHAMVIAAALAFGIVSRPVMALLDEYTMAVIGPSRKADWGSYRVFGAYGWALSALLLSYVGGTFGWGFGALVYLPATATMVWCVHQCPVTRGAPGAHHYGDVLRRFAGMPRVVAFWLGSVAMGVGSSLIGSFLFLYLRSPELDAPPLLLGICVVFTVAIEVPLFRSSAALYARFTDQQLLMTAMTAWVVRVLGYSLLTNPWYVLCLEPLHGFTFGLTWLSGMRFFPAAFPSEFSNSSVSLLHAAYSGVGPMLGNVFGGYAFEALGPRMMFRWAALLMTVAGAAAHTAYTIAARREAAAAAAKVESDGGNHPHPLTVAVDVTAEMAQRTEVGTAEEGGGDGVASPEVGTAATKEAA